MKKKNLMMLPLVALLGLGLASCEQPVEPVVTLTLPATGVVGEAVEIAYEVDQADCVIAVSVLDPSSVRSTLTVDSFVPTAEGVHKVRVEATNADGLKGKAEKEITIHVAPKVELTLPELGVVDTKVEFSYTVDDAESEVTMSLESPEGVKSTLEVAEFTPDAVGEWKVVVAAENEEGFVGKAEGVVEVLEALDYAWKIALDAANEALEVEIPLPRPDVDGITGFELHGDYYDDGTQVISIIGLEYVQASYDAVVAWMDEVAIEMGLVEDYDVDGNTALFAPDGSYNVGIFTIGAISRVIVCLSTLEKYVPVPAAEVDASWAAALAAVSADLEVEITPTLLPRIQHHFIEGFDAAGDLYNNGYTCIVLEGIPGTLNNQLAIIAWADALVDFEADKNSDGLSVYFAPEDLFNFGLTYNADLGVFILFFSTTGHAGTIDDLWNSMLASASAHLDITVADVPRFGADGSDITGYGAGTAGATMAVVILEGSVTQAGYDAWMAALDAADYTAGADALEGMMVEPNGVFAVAYATFNSGAIKAVAIVAA